MKIAIVAAVLILLVSSSVLAHSPKDITIAFNGKTIEITVEHPVSDPTTHYVKKITVKVNGQDLVDQSFTSQDGDYQRFKVEAADLKKGDSVEVSAYCSRYGERTEQAEVP